MRSLGGRNGFSPFFQSRSSVLPLLLFGRLAESYPVCPDHLLYQGFSLISNGITVTLMFLTINRTGCFAVSDLQSQSHHSAGGAKVAQVSFNYRLGVRLGLGVLVWL
jgi:hypothetical protein